jgi:hypothetical protein
MYTKYRYYDAENSRMVYVDESDDKMPSTHTMDIDGVEAYVGDIIEYGVGFIKKGVIIFENGSFLIKPVGPDSLLERIDTGFRIIGNIIENEDLLHGEEI